MKHCLILILILILSFSLQGFSTPQVPDKLIYKGDTLRVYLYLPDDFYKFDTMTFKLDTVTIDSFEFINSILTVSLFGDKKTCKTTGCGREYQATWEIIAGQLYLTGIYSCCYYEDSIKADLTSLFKEKVIDGKVKADWITGDFISFQGKRLLYDHDMGEGGIFEYELELHFEDGKLIGTQLYDNRKTKQSEYSQNGQKTIEYIYSNINWDILPKLDTTVRVVVEFSANEDGIIDSAKIRRGYNEIYDQEAIRVVKSIPEWDVYFRKGKHVRMPWNMPITFSEENRLEYKKE